MNDNRFEFEQFERPLTWLNFYKGAGGGFRSNGKMKLPPGHALAKKFPDKVASKEEMEARAAKMGGAGGGDGDGEKPAKAGTRSDTPPEFFQIPVSYLKGDSKKFDDAEVERRAKSIVDSGGLVSPILVERVDLQTYKVLPGSELDHAASIRAKQMDPRVGEFANIFLVTKENKAAVQEQLSLRSKPSAAEKRVVKETTGGETKYLPYDAKDGVGYYQLPVTYLKPSVQEKHSQKKVDRMANAIVNAGGLVAPIVVQQESPNSYKILSGHFEYAAAMKAKGINTKIGEFANVIIVPPDRTQAIAGQL